MPLHGPPSPGNSATSLRPRRLVWPRTPAFHAGNVGSNPAGDAVSYLLDSAGTPSEAWAPLSVSGQVALPVALRAAALSALRLSRCTAACR